MCIQVFTHGNCPEQLKAMAILDQYGIEYQVIDLGKHSLKKQTMSANDDDLLDMVLCGIL